MYRPKDDAFFIYAKHHELSENLKEEKKMAENEKVFYDVNMFKRGETLKDCVLTISGSIKSVNRRQSKQGKEYLGVEFESVLGDKFVRENFGEDFVNPDHKVTFRFPIAGWRMADFEKYPPRWGQHHICMLENMEIGSYTKKDGSTTHFVNCLGQIASLGSRKKADGTDRPPVTIFGKGESAPEPTETPTPASADLEILEDDPDCPF